MDKSFYRALKIIFSATAVCAGLTAASGQNSFTMQLVADNDFAVFSGTSSGVNNLLYQNNAAWPDQINNLSTLSFNLATGDNMFYILGMGGGGEENISGAINGIDIAVNSTYDPESDSFNYTFNPLNVQMSSDLGAYLENWGTQSLGGTVADGTYDAALADVQSAFPNLTWGSPDVNNSDGVISQASPNGYGFHFDESSAHLFAIDAGSLGVVVTPAPEPSTFTLLAMAGMMGLAWKYLRSKSTRSGNVADCAAK